MESKFDVIEYLSGLTTFVFDVAVLKRIAYRRGIANADSYDAIDDDTERYCTRDLLITVLRGPWSTASSTTKHGSFEKIIGQQTITANALEEIKAQIRQLNRELDLPEDDGIPQAATNEWVDESEWL